MTIVKRLLLLWLILGLVSSGPSYAYAEVFEYTSLGATGEVKIVSKNPGAQFGASLIDGDFNGDQIYDIAVSSPYFSSESKQWNGMVSIYFGGNKDGQSFEEADIRILGGSEGDQIGSSMASGDFNVDGIDDLVIGSPNALMNGERVGVTYVIYGHSSWSRQTIDLSINRADFQLSGHSEGDRFGESLSTVDMNKDGVEDLVIGSPNSSYSGQKNIGSAHLFLGPLNARLNDNLSLKEELGDVNYYGHQEGEKFGSEIESGDFNYDGKNDLAIGAFKSDTEVGVDAGRVYVYRGVETLFKVFQSPTLTIEGTKQNEWFGFSMDKGKLSEDRIDDLVVGTFPYNSEENGGVSIFYGGDRFEQKGLVMLNNSDFADVKIGGQSGKVKTASEIKLGDVNYDGYLDLIIGSPNISTKIGDSSKGGIYVLYNSPDGFKSNYEVTSNEHNLQIMNDSSDDWFGYKFAMTDFNGNGSIDFIVGSRYADNEFGQDSGEITVIEGNFGVIGEPLVVGAENEVNVQGVSRAETVSKVIDGFRIREKKSQIIENCYEFIDFCFFNFSAMSNYDGIAFEPDVILYPDVPANHKFNEEITIATMLGLVNGYLDDEDSPFKPDIKVTRIQALKIVLSAADLVPMKYKFELVDILGSLENIQSQPSYFDDVNPRIDYMWWYPRYVNFAAERGIINKANQNFRPDDYVSLDELEIMINNTLNYLNEG